MSPPASRVAAPRSSALTQGRQQLILGPGDELALLFRPHLDQGEVGEARVGELPGRLDVYRRIGAARHQPGDVLLADVRGCGVERAGLREIGRASCRERV